ncbi:MAG TPA: VWA domain-containing protein [Chthonomonadales bacterium]|nr:VWA domain-containing protein [Chthonomonadales bacterium]
MEDRTQQMGGVASGGGPADRTVNLGAADPARTAIGVPIRALDLEVLCGNRYANATALSREHLLLILRSSGAALGRRMPLNLCLVIDRSGSMEGEPLDYVKRACGYVVDLLEPTDVLSIVTFEEQVEVVMPARRVVNRALIKEHVQRIQPGNTTNLYDGIAAGGAQILSAPMPGVLQRLLLLTDGEPTAGIKDFASIVQQVGDLRQRGISVTALGFGGEYNEELMAGIARRSGGNYYYIQQPSQIPEVFRREMETLMTTTARGVRVRLRTPSGVRARYVYGVASPQFGARSVEYALPDVERGGTIANLVELEFDRHVPGVYRVARADVAYDDIVTNRPEALTGDCLIEFTRDTDLVAGGVNGLVQRELQVHLASRNLERTIMGMRTQQLTALGAVQELQRTQAILQQAGRTAQAGELEQAIQAVQQGGQAEKTLIGTVYTLEQGKQSR